jgi:Kef-type K+ transport system membrane component KefB
LKALSLEDLLLPLLIQLALIIATARVFAVLFRHIAQPAVVGEIVAGLVLGPSVLGRLCPEVFNALFHPALAGLPADASDVTTFMTTPLLLRLMRGTELEPLVLASAFLDRPGEEKKTATRGGAGGRGREP